MIKKNKLLLLLALLAAFPPLSTDMYLAAIPLLEKTWNQPLAVMNLTLVVFFISYCFCLLFYGPLSDRFGRRPLLLIGVGIFILGSLMCAGAGQVTGLIVFRAIQASGAASASVLSLAITKDVYQGQERARMLAYIGVIMALAPMLAPVFGGWVLTWFSWRWIFVIQAIIAAVAWFGVFAMEETLKSRSSKGVLQTAGIYLHLLGNRRYMKFALMFSLVVLPHFAFIGGSSSIYITGFGLSEQAFGYFFAMNALSIMMGAFACTRLLSSVGERWLLTAGFAGIMVGGVVMLFSLLPGPWALALPMALISFSFGISRPPSNHLVLEQVDEYAGSASSLLIFIYFMMGAFAMWLIALDWTDKIHTIGVLGAGAGGVILCLWLLVSRNPTPKPVDLVR